MSVRFFIGPFDPKLWEDPNSPPDPEPVSSLRIDPVAYKKALFKRWPSVKEISFDEIKGVVWWRLNEHNQWGVEVRLQNNFQYVSISSSGVNFIEFILWHRAYVPDEYPLFLFSDSGWDSLMLTPATTKEEVVQFAGFR